MPFLVSTGVLQARVPTSLEAKVMDTGKSDLTPAAGTPDLIPAAGTPDLTPAAGTPNKM